MGKVKHTKNELKAQREALARYLRFLPTLELKKAQLISEIQRISASIEKIKKEIASAEREIEAWVAVLGEDIDLRQWIAIKEVKTSEGNIAGIDIRIFDELIFEDIEYDLYKTPLWVDRALEEIKQQLMRRMEVRILQEQIEILQEELRITIQRINLFEKVKIPEARENIRMIQIFLGDLQTAEVVRGKIAKAKIEKKKEQAPA